MFFVIIVIDVKQIREFSFNCEMESLGGGAWTINDELKLLTAIINWGFGNWADVALHVPPFTANQCEIHYLRKFSLDFDGLRKAPLCSNNCKTRLEENDLNVHSSFDIWNNNQTLASMKWQDESINKKPIGFGVLPRVKNLTSSIPCTGYNNIRSDFMIEFNNNDEDILKMIGLNQQEELLNDEDHGLISEMECALLQSYNSCLVERNKRKKIVRNHALLDRKKTYNMLQRLEVPFGKHTLKVLLPIMRFLNGPQFDLLVERLKYQNDIRLKLNSYIDYRLNGLKYLNTIDIYKKLKNKRLKYSAELLYESTVLKTDEKIPQRKPIQPLALEHLPGYHLLSEDEKTLCSTSRVVPETYNSFKELLIVECKKHDGLKLAQARSLIKIDVNKTRKIFDYLISTNLIWLPEET